VTDQFLHLPGIGKPPYPQLREDQLAVASDLKGTTGALDQLRVDIQLLLDVCRQTGGSGVVVSNHTIFDLDLDSGCHSRGSFLA
jgi:hypothetical protein